MGSQKDYFEALETSSFWCNSFRGESCERIGLHGISIFFVVLFVINVMVNATIVFLYTWKKIKTNPQKQKQKETIPMNFQKKPSVVGINEYQGNSNIPIEDDDYTEIHDETQDQDDIYENVDPDDSTEYDEANGWTPNNSSGNYLKPKSEPKDTPKSSHNRKNFGQATQFIPSASSLKVTGSKLNKSNNSSPLPARRINPGPNAIDDNFYESVDNPEEEDIYENPNP